VSYVCVTETGRTVDPVVDIKRFFGKYFVFERSEEIEVRLA